MKTVSDVMTRTVRTATTEDVVGPLRDLMLDGRLHGVPIIDSAGALVGIVTSSDLVEEWAPAQGVITAMSSPVHTVTPTTTAVDASRVMVDHEIHHLPVVDHGEVVGMVSSHDLLRVMAGEVEATATPTTAPRRPARPGDLVFIRSHAIGHRERRGLIVEARGADGQPPFVVQWLDDPHAEPHEVLFFPGPDADIEPEMDTVASNAT
jgi:predicted transcriptional regulator